MKKRIFLRKLSLVLIAMALFAGSIGFFVSCETREACEINGTGDITIINNTGFTFVFDVDNLGEVTLRNGQRKVYSNVPAGSHRLYYWDDFYEGWYYNSYTLRVCEDLEYTWTLNKKKSTDRQIVPGVYINGTFVPAQGELIVDFNK